MALVMATRRAAAAVSSSSNSLGRIFNRKPHLPSAAAPSMCHFARYFSDGKDSRKPHLSDKLAINPGICDRHMQNSFQTSGPKEAYEVSLLLRMEIPGIHKDDAKVLVDNEDTVYVKGEGNKESTYEQNGKAYNFRVKIPPHHYITDQDMEVEMKSGVLRMTIPTSPKMEAEIENRELKIGQGGQGKGEVIHDEKDVPSGDVETQDKEAEMNGGVEVPKSMTPKENHNSGTSKKKPLQTHEKFLIFTVYVPVLLLITTVFLSLLSEFLTCVNAFLTSTKHFLTSIHDFIFGKS